MRKLTMLILGLAAAVALPAGSGKKLSFEQVYLNRGETLLRPLPVILGWTDDQNYVELRAGQLVRVRARDGRSSPILDPKAGEGILPAELSPARAEDHSADYQTFIFDYRQDLYLFRPASREFVQLTDSPAAERNPTLSPDGRWLAYTVDGNLQVCELAGRSRRALTGDGSATILNGYASWVYYEEILGRSSRYRAFWWSPDSRKIAFLRFDQGPVTEFPLFDAGGDYGRLELQRYPKAGYPVPAARLGVVEIDSGRIQWAPLPEGGEEHYLALPKWDESGGNLYFQWESRAQDHLRLYRFAPATGELSQLYEERQPSWVEFGEGSDYLVMPGGGVLLISSKDGWNHIYRVDARGNQTQLTRGPWSVTGLELFDSRRRRVIFSARKEDSTETDLYELPLEGAPLRRLTVERGNHLVSLSPGGRWFTDRYSALGVPWRLLLCQTDGSTRRTLGDSRTEVFDRYELGTCQRFRIPTADGLQLPASWILPPGFQPTRTYPLVLNVYGGPGAGSVTDAFPRGLGDFYLAQQGIIVMSADHRGSGHFGKAGEALMARRLGHWEMSDLVEVVKYLRTLPFVDGGRIGITGGSYGGYVTALALAKEPDFFRCGIAEYAVIDWRLYDAVYTERFMGTPQQNPDGYRDASVLSYVDGYRGGLRVHHGTMDDNVHLQNVLQFLDKLENAGKQVELMLFPGERHGIRGVKSPDAQRQRLDFWFRHFFNRPFVTEAGRE